MTSPRPRPDSTVNTILGIIGLLYAIQHVLIFIIIIFTPKLRRNKTSQILLNLNLSYIYIGATNFAQIFCSYQIGFLQVPGVFYANTALAILSIDRVIFIRWPFVYQQLSWRYHLIKLTLAPLIFLVPFAKMLIQGAVDSASAQDSVSVHTKIFGTIAVMAV